jgi:hypothetical protein
MSPVGGCVEPVAVAVCPGLPLAVRSFKPGLQGRPGAGIGALICRSRSGLLLMTVMRWRLDRVHLGGDMRAAALRSRACYRPLSCRPVMRDPATRCRLRDATEFRRA